MSYALTILWYDRQRYLPGVLAVSFSALLIALQCGLLLGLFSITSLPIDHTNADIWIGAPGVLSVDLGRPIREATLARLENQPEIERTEIYLQGFSYWSKSDGGTELCMVIGSRLDENALGKVNELTKDLYEKLEEPGAIVIDESDMERLSIKAIGDVAEVAGNRVRVVGMTKTLKSLAGPYVFCSVTTARPLLRVFPDQITYVLGKCKDPADAKTVVARLRENNNFSAFTSAEFSFRSRWHWLTKTKAGIALGYAAALGLLVGAVVTSQTLYSATMASLKEFAVLRAMGIPKWRMQLLVMTQSFWVGISGIVLAFPAVHGLAELADRLGVRVELPFWLLGGAATVTISMALFAGLLALRSLKSMEPAALLR
ncbi:MAG: FtsX-like permease family protein [Gemmataceae bacterium]|nr:FtsX-like permease family protein [Gemmataceae bacterium]